MSLGVVCLAVRQEGHGTTTTLVVLVALVATNLGVKCSLQCVLDVTRTPKCHSSLEAVDQSIVAIAIIKSHRKDTRWFDSTRNNRVRVI